MRVKQSDIDRINDDFQDEYVKLGSLLFHENSEFVNIDFNRLEGQIDKCMAILEEFKKLKDKAL